jgi:hypothetical protein
MRTGYAAFVYPIGLCSLASSYSGGLKGPEEVTPRSAIHI